MSKDNSNGNKAYNSATKKAKGNSKLVKLEVAGLAINLLAVATCAFALSSALTFKVPPEIIAVSDTGSYFEKVPLDQANKDDIAVKQWMTDRLGEAFSYDFTEMNTHAASIAHNYTPEAITYLDKFINGSMLAKKVKKDAGIVKLILADGIKLQSGKVGSKYGWRGTTKGALVLQSKAGMVRLGRYNVSVVAIRADESENQEGLKITNISMGKL